MIEKKQKESYFNIYKKKDPSCCAIKLIFHTLEFILQKKHTYIKIVFTLIPLYVIRAFQVLLYIFFIKPLL
jgi:hypothetical protein